MNDPAESLLEQVLVLRCKAGDEAAFAELVQRYHRRVRYYVERMLDAHLADDVIQEVWLEVFRSIGRLESAKAFAAWIYRIARARVCRELRRRRVAFVELETTELAEDIAEEDFADEDAAEVHEALTELAAEQREVLMLRFVESMSYEQIAAVIGCEIGTVRSRLHYAKASLRQRIERKRNHDGRKQTWSRAAQSGR